MRLLSPVSHPKSVRDHNSDNNRVTVPSRRRHMSQFPIHSVTPLLLRRTGPVMVRDYRACADIVIGTFADRSLRLKALRHSCARLYCILSILKHALICATRTLLLILLQHRISNSAISYLGHCSRNLHSYINLQLYR